MKLIESKANPLVKKIISLKNTAARKEHSLFTIEGIRSVNEIPADWIIVHIFISQTFYNTSPLTDSLITKDCYLVPDHIFKALSDTVTPQGILAVVQKKMYSYRGFIEQTRLNAFYIACESVQDPGNLGAVIRTCAAAGVDGVFLSPDCVDLFNPKVLRATMGSIFQLPVFYDVDLIQFTNEINALGIHTIGTHLGGAVSPYELNLKEPTAFYIGNEANGLTDSLSSLCRTLSKIPILRNTESLNMAVATGVVIYETLRQRLFL